MPTTSQIQRKYTETLEADLAAQGLSPILFVRLKYDDGDILIHDWVGTITWGGEDWLGVGDFGTIESVEETSEITNLNIQLILSGLNNELRQEALDSNYYRREVIVYYGSLDLVGRLKIDSDGNTVEPDVLWAGFMDVMTARVEGDESSITLTAENEDVDFHRPNGKMYSHAQQSVEYPGDTGCIFLDRVEGMVLEWPTGVRGPYSSSRTAGRTNRR